MDSTRVPVAEAADPPAAVASVTKGQAPEEDKAVQAMAKRMDLTRRRAAHAAARLLAARAKKTDVMPKDPIELLDMLDAMIKNSRRWGVYLTPFERRELAIWHMYKRAQIQRAKAQEVPPPADLSGILAEEDR